MGVTDRKRVHKHKKRRTVFTATAGRPCRKLSPSEYHKFNAVQINGVNDDVVDKNHDFFRK